MGRILTLLLSLAFVHVTFAAEQVSFEQYLQNVRSMAIEEGISEATIDQAFDGLTRDERVIGFDRRQPEFTQTFEEYLSARISDFRIREGRRLFHLHKTLLLEVADRYGVDPEYIVAFWGLETSFGRYQGKYSIIRSLATLGHDPRRSGFFTSELVKALRILDEKHITPEKFVGAWAGAMGQGQFMPSSFLGHAQDFDGDGRKDIWASEADVFASIANYLSHYNWVRGAGWGAPVLLGEEFDLGSFMPEQYDKSCWALRHHTKKLSVEDWQSLGVSGEGLKPASEYALVKPDADSAQSFLVGGNFRAILRYNCANKYAVSVGLFAEKIVSPESS
jgi:membrane-bound lytic murein transglycosylase B